MQTNVRIANVAWSLQGNGTCGVSAVALSALFSSPGGLFPPGGNYLLTLTNDAAVAPIHIESRMLWTDKASTVQATPLAQFVTSNTQTFGGGAQEAQSLLLALSGSDVAVPLNHIAGSGVQIVVMTASNTASAVALTGHAALWRV